MSAAALDRQIRPIYDALDIGSNKSAIVACNKLLKKHPKNELIKALKALALVRSQKVEESLVLCDEVLGSKPTQDPVLTAMMHVLRGLGRHRDMVSMFEEAYKQQPMNEELGAQTFFANVRASQWKSAQQVATAMHKRFQDERYLYWSSISAVLQANDPNTLPNMKELLYKLAHRLISSSSGSSYHSADRFYLHLSILRELGLLDDARELLDNEVGKAICNTSLSCNELRRDIYRLRGMIKEEGRLAETNIVEHKDRNWLEFLSVINGTFSYLQENNDPDSRAACQDHMVMSERLFTRILEEDGTKDRSGLLALLELEKRSRCHGLSNNSARLFTQLRRYFDTFGEKSCCFEDLKPYLFLEGDELAQWISFLDGTSLAHAEALKSDSPTPFPMESEKFARLINCHKLLRYSLSESDLNVDAESTRLNIYLQHYLEGLKLGKDLPSTELQYADDFALLATNVLVNLWNLTANDNYLANAAVLLEFALTKSKQLVQARLILIRIYRLLGAPSLALEHYRTLQIKQIQHETLSHLVLSRASTFSSAAVGDLTFVTECIESTQIYLSNSQETSDYIIRAFSSEKYSQIPEFIAFEDHLDNSLQRDLAKLEHLRMRLTHETITSDLIDMELIELKFIFDRSHHDNRDFEIFINYQPKSSRTIAEQTRLFKKQEGLGWATTFLKLYIRAFQQASDLDDTVEEKLLIGDRPKLTSVANKAPLRDRLIECSEDELAELTADEISFADYARSLADWLEPYHDYTRPPPSVVLAEVARQTELKTGHPLKGVNLQALNGTVQGNGKKDEELPVIADPPELIVAFFDSLRARFFEACQNSSVVQILHIATIAQDALILFVIETMRFKSSSVVKINKLGALVATFKSLRTKAIDVLRDISAALLKQSEVESSAERVGTFLDGLTILTQNEINDEFASNAIKKLSEARKKVLEGVGKGIAKVCTIHS